MNFDEDLYPALKDKKWKDLNEMQLEVLWKIASSKSKSQVIKNVFQGIDKTNKLNKNLWDIINFLELLKLIHVERFSERSNIIDFHVHSELLNELNINYPNKFISLNESDNFGVFSITLNNSLNNREFNGFFKVKSMKIFNPADEYNYKATLNDDGTITLVIKNCSNF